MGRPVGSDLDFQTVARIRNLPAPVANDEPVRLTEMNAALEGLAWKDNVRCAPPSNVTLSAPGSTLDGLTMANGDRVLLMNQTTGSENGIYVWNGASTPMTRAYDMQVSADFKSAVVPVDDGTTNGGTTWRQTVVSVTVGTTTPVFSTFGASIPDATTSTKGKVQLATQTEVNTGTDTGKVVTPATLAGSNYAKLKYSASIGDGSATSYTVTHNLNTRDVTVQVYETSGNYREVEVEVQRTSVNAVTVIFASAPSTNAYRVVVIG